MGNEETRSTGQDHQSNEDDGGIFSLIKRHSNLLSSVIVAIITGIFLFLWGDVGAVRESFELTKEAEAAAFYIDQTVEARSDEIETRAVDQAFSELDDDPIEIEVTRLVEIPQEVTVPPIEVTRIVEAEVPVEVTRIVAEEVEVTRIVTETIFVEGNEDNGPFFDADTIVSTFDGNSLDGWLMINGNVTNPGSGGSGGGLDNGALTFVDKEIYLAYYVAPSKYHVDWRAFSQLRFDIWSSGGPYESSDKGDIYIANGAAVARYVLPARPPEQFTEIIIPLDTDNGWEFGGGATTLEDILVNVTDFQIRAEYGDFYNDASGLDNVMLIPAQ